MKKTLLRLVQSVLNDLDSDSVNSIDDTVEAQQVAQIIKDCYEEILANRNWPHLRKLVQLEASNDISKPNYLRIPEHTKELSEFRYDCRKVDELKIQFKNIKFLYPDEFLQLIFNRDSTLDSVDVITDDSGIQLPILNNKSPEYWTSFNDEWLVTDSYDKAVDDTLKKSKTSAICYIETELVIDDATIPDLPDEAFALLLEESKSTASIVLKQMANQKAEQKANRQQRWLSRKAWRTNSELRFPNYGRKGGR